MAKKKSKPKSNKIIVIIIATLVLGIGIAATVNQLLDSRQPKVASKGVFTTATANETNKTTKIEPKINNKQNLEPEVTNKQNKESAPEQGKEDKKAEIQPEQTKTQQTPSVHQPAKSNEKLIDPFFENYLNIYVNLANDSELEFYYLDNVVVKTSKFYKSLTDEIQKLRQAKIKYTLDDFKIESITKGENEAELTVQVSQTINKKVTKYTYTVYFDKAGVFIKDRK